jgi:hypothetical protein
MIFADAAPLSQFFFIRAMLVQVVTEVAQTNLLQSNTPLLGTLSQHHDHFFFAFQIIHVQIDEFRNTDTSIIE